VKSSVQPDGKVDRPAPLKGRYPHLGIPTLPRKGAQVHLVLHSVRSKYNVLDLAVLLLELSQQPDTLLGRRDGSIHPEPTSLKSYHSHANIHQHREGALQLLKAPNAAWHNFAAKSLAVGQRRKRERKPPIPSLIPGSS